MPDVVDLHPATLQRVADWLRGSREAVVQAWSAAVRADPRIQSDRSISYADFVDHIPNVLEEVCQRLRGMPRAEEEPRIRREARQHGFLRWRQGYDLAELLHEMGHLRAVVIDFAARARDALGLSRDDQTVVVRLASEIIDEGQVATVLSYVAERDREAEGRDRDIAARDDALRETERRLQEALLQEERRRVDALEADARAKDDFLATLSHELRTPLTPILAWITVLERTGAAAPLPRAVGTIGRNARVLSQLIDDLLDVSRIVSGKLDMARDPLDAREFVRAACDTVQADADARDVRLVLHDPHDPVPVTGDATRLQQVVWNLLSNAVKFSPPGAEVSVSLSVDEPAAAACIVVTDRGVGIDPAFLPHVFDRFSQQDQGRTRGHGGLGLGLAIARAITEGHGGRLTASSEGLGHGSSFELRFPLRRGTAPGE